VRVDGAVEPGSTASSDGFLFDRYEPGTARTAAFAQTPTEKSKWSTGSIGSFPEAAEAADLRLPQGDSTWIKPARDRPRHPAPIY
jgi:hypothetical protein